MFLSDSRFCKFLREQAHFQGEKQSLASRLRTQNSELHFFGFLRCDCRQQLEMALSMIAQAGAGVLVYEQQEGRGIGLMAKLQAYELQDRGLDTVQANEQLGFKADHREFQLPAEILKTLDLKSVRL